MLKHGESAYPADAWVEQQYMKEDALAGGVSTFCFLAYTLEGAIREFWVFKATLFVDKIALEMYKQILFGRIDLLVHFLSFISTNVVPMSQRLVVEPVAYGIHTPNKGASNQNITNNYRERSRSKCWVDVQLECVSLRCL